jgi:hypothetical protein
MNNIEGAPIGLVWDGDRAPFAKAFVAAQKATEAVKKASTNPAFRSKYADLAGVVEAVVPALNENGIAVIQSPAFEGDFVSLTTILLHESGSSVSGTLRLRPSKMDPQGVGSAITYARRYALLSMSGAAPEDDDGNAASSKSRGSEPEVPSRKSSAQAKRDGDHERILGMIQACATEDVLDLWYRQKFDQETKELPLSWIDPLRNEVEKHRETIRGGEFRQSPDGSISGVKPDNQAA